MASIKEELTEALSFFKPIGPPTDTPGDGKVPIIVTGPRFAYKWYSKGDIDSFFALFFDNLSSLISILLAFVKLPKIATNCWTADPVVSCSRGDGVPNAGEFVLAFEELVFEKICPGIAFALVFGNLYYAFMAYKLAKYEKRQDVTALPYGINTPAGFIAAYDVMLPIAFSMRVNPDIYNADADAPTIFAEKCWKAGCALTFVGGLFEIGGIIMGPICQRIFSKAAFYAPIASVGFVWLGFSPLISLMAEPIVGIIPFAMCFTGFFAAGGKGVYPSGLAALQIMAVGTILKWSGALKWPMLTTGFTQTDPDSMWGTHESPIATSSANAGTVSYAWYKYAGKNSMKPFECLDGFGDIKNYVAIIFPVALQSFIETIENVEAARVMGDHYNVVEAMLTDGLGTCIGAMFGSTLPTTVYIGHRRHKIAGARALYSILNAFAYFILLMAGLFPAIAYFVDSVSVGVILIFVGLMICQQAFEVSAPRHYPALCIGLMFVICEMMFFDYKDQNGIVRTGFNSGRMYGAANMAPGGGIMCSLIVSQLVCDLIDLKFFRCSMWSIVAALFSLFGIMHANNLWDQYGQMTCSWGSLCVSTIDTNPEPPTFMADFGFNETAWTRSGLCKYIHLGEDKPGYIPAKECGWDPIFEMDNVAISGGFLSAYDGTPAMDCVDWMFSDQAIGFGEPATMNLEGGVTATRNFNGCLASVYYLEAIKTDWGVNEGWRFACAYSMLAAFCMIHLVFQKVSGDKFCGPEINDGGADPNFKGALDVSEPAGKETNTAQVSSA